jgi:hypothetical protein
LPKHRLTAIQSCDNSHMTSNPYRSSSIGSPHQQSLRDIRGLAFIEMPALRGALCTDMYGDMPYGLFVVPNCYLLGDAGYIFTAEMKPLLEQNAGFLRKGKFVRPRLEEIASSAETTATATELVSLVSRCDSYFWHWMIDSLPKVLIAEDCGFQGCYLLPEPTRAPWAAESLRLLNIAPERLMTKGAFNLHAARMYVPTYFCGNNAHLNTDLMQLFRERIRAAAHPMTPSEQRIFVARRELSKIRRVVNQDAVEEVLKAFNFATVYLEDLSLPEQISLVRATNIMVGPHGSGLTHALFMDNYSTLIELFPHKRRQANNCYETLASIPRHAYRAVESMQRNDGDIEINTAELTNALKPLV